MIADHPAMVPGSRPAQILFVSPVAERGGAETVLLTLVRGLDRTRFRPMVVFLKDGPFAEEVASVGVETVVIPTRRARYLPDTLRAIRAIRRLIRERQVKLVFGNMAMGHLYGGLAALGTAAKAVWFQHGIITHPDLVDRLIRWIPSIHAYVNSHSAARQSAGRSRDCAEVIFPGVDLGRFEKSRYPYGATREELGIPPNAPVVMSVARFQRWKGQEVLLEAAGLIQRRGINAHFILVGDTVAGLEPDHRKAVSRRAGDLGLQKAVHFVGFRNDVPRLLRDADVLAHSSILPEAFGLVLVEAMAMELPVVASQGGGPDEIVVEEETGYLVPPGDPEALAERVMDLLADPGRRTAMGQAGRRRAEELFSARRMIFRFEESFERVLADGS
ncbi:MAG: glycosyltransferase [candidate division NC10 bacterium]|nr:glycosyltransferase [candidate division NC10 bacterium]